MTEIPEHLLKRAQAARAKAESEAGIEREPQRDPRIPPHLLERSRASSRTSDHLLGRLGQAGVDPRVPAHLQERSRAAAAKAGRASGYETTPADIYASYQTKLQAAITKRQEAMPDKPVAQFVLESFQGSLVMDAGLRRFISAFKNEIGWDYQGDIPDDARRGISDFRSNILNRSLSTSTEAGDFESGAQATARAWALLSSAEQPAVQPMPEHFKGKLFRKAVGRVGLIGGVKAVLDGTPTYQLINRAEGFKVPAAFDDAIVSFQELLNAPKESDEWDLNHWQKTDRSVYAQLNVSTEIYRPRAFAAGARLVASMIEG